MNLLAYDLLAYADYCQDDTNSWVTIAQVAVVLLMIFAFLAAGALFISWLVKRQ